MLKGPRNYDNADADAGSVGTTRTFIEFAKGIAYQRAVVVRLVNKHNTATVTVYPDDASVKSDTVGPGDSWTRVFPDGIKRLTMVSDTAATPIEVTTYEKAIETYGGEL